MPRPFLDRRDAGRQLAGELSSFAGRADTMVVGIPRGGMPVAREVGRALGAPVGSVLVRRFGLPRNDDLTLGAVGLGGVGVFNTELIQSLHVPDYVVTALTLEARWALLQDEQATPDSAGRPAQGRRVILVDDGMASGTTMRAAIDVLQRQQPAEMVVAVPTAAREVGEQIRGAVDSFVCLHDSDPFFAIHLSYEQYPEIDDAPEAEARRGPASARTLDWPIMTPAAPADTGGTRQRTRPPGGDAPARFIMDATPRRARRAEDVQAPPLARHIGGSPVKAALIAYFRAAPQTALTSDDVAAHLGQPRAAVRAALTDLAALGLVERREVAGLVFFRLTRDPGLQQELRELAAWQARWLAQAAYLLSEIGAARAQSSGAS